MKKVGRKREYDEQGKSRERVGCERRNFWWSLSLKMNGREGNRREEYKGVSTRGLNLTPIASLAFDSWIIIEFSKIFLPFYFYYTIKFSYYFENEKKKVLFMEWHINF